MLMTIKQIAGLSWHGGESSTTLGNTGQLHYFFFSQYLWMMDDDVGFVIS